jgi:ATP-dependent protease HslVU (ClpYQ) peptidase subunit
MTCIVGLRQGGKVYIGGDSAGIAGWDVTIRADPKVFVAGDYAMGFTTSFRLGQLLQYRLKLPKPPSAQKKLYPFMVSEFVEAVRECLKTGGVATKDKESEQGGQFLVGVSGRLFIVEGDYQVAEPVAPFAAIGSGAPYALGALAISRGSPLSRVRQALSVAERFSAGVRAPFRVLLAPRS